MTDPIARSKLLEAVEAASMVEVELRGEPKSRGLRDMADMLRDALATIRAEAERLEPRRKECCADLEAGGECVVCGYWVPR